MSSQRATSYEVAMANGVQPAAQGNGYQVFTGTAGDHLAIQQFMLQVCQQPSANEFQAQLDEPRYEPTDRLLVKRGGQIISHLRLLRRDIQFGSSMLPTVVFADFATLPEYRGRGLGTALLQVAEKRIRAEGAALAMLRAHDTQFYRNRDWARLGQSCYSKAPVRNVLARCAAQSASAATPQSAPLAVRFWRHIEQDSLAEIYNANARSSYGATIRNEAYWRWLLSRRAYDRIYVAIEGSAKSGLNDDAADIVGYAVTRSERIVELMAAPDRPEAAVRLLHRACGDAIERDMLEIRVDAPSYHPIHDWMTGSSQGDFAQAKAISDDSGPRWMAKWVDRKSPMRLMRETLCKRVREAGLETPYELGLRLDSQKLTIEITGRTVRMRPGNLGRSYLACGNEEFTRMMLGATDLSEAIAGNRVEASTRIARETAAILFPKLPVWFTPWDDMPA